jgi:D-glycero-D-manno-heptose 1,7-bisphosphate phosphatase
MGHDNSKRGVFLDRDGVINEVVFRDGKPASPRSVSEFRFCEGVADALQRLSRAGLRLFVVTNQPDLARGLLAPAVIEEINKTMLASLPIEGISVCPHDDVGGCPCRKPKPGLLYGSAASAGVDLARSFLIGDSWKDMEAGRRAGCRTILLRRPYNVDVDAEWITDTLTEATDLILGELAHVTPHCIVRQ